MVLTGVLLASGLALVFIEAVGYNRGGYNSAFWKLPLDSKLDHVTQHTWEWWWISIWGLIGLGTLTGGVFGLASLLSSSGEPVVASVALGIYVSAVLAWLIGLIFQAAAVSEAAKQRSETNETPAWLHPFWTGGWVAEVAWIGGANVAYAVFGIAVIQSGLIGSWVGWVAVIGGVLITAVVGLTRNGFPQLSLLVPAFLGIVLIFHG